MRRALGVTRCGAVAGSRDKMFTQPAGGWQRRYSGAEVAGDGEDLRRCRRLWGPPAHGEGTAQAND